MQEASQVVVILHLIQVSKCGVPYSRKLEDYAAVIHSGFHLLNKCMIGLECQPVFRVLR